MADPEETEGLTLGGAAERDWIRVEKKLQKEAADLKIKSLLDEMISENQDMRLYNDEFLSAGNPLVKDQVTENGEWKNGIFRSVYLVVRQWTDEDDRALNRKMEDR